MKMYDSEFQFLWFLSIWRKKRKIFQHSIPHPKRRKKIQGSKDQHDSRNSIASDCNWWYLEERYFLQSLAKTSKNRWLKIETFLSTQQRNMILEFSIRNYIGIEWKSNSLTSRPAYAHEFHDFEKRRRIFDKFDTGVFYINDISVYLLLVCVLDQIDHQSLNSEYHQSVEY